jgi:hypothetical protein
VLSRFASGRVFIIIIMRKLSMNRPSKLNLAAKKVSPPSLPPTEDGGLVVSHYDLSYERYSHSDDIAAPPRLRTFESGTAAVQRPAGFREPFFPPMCSPPATSPSPSVAGEDGCSSSSAYSSSSLLSSVSSPGVAPHGGGGSRHSVSSVDSGWGGPSGQSAAVGSGWGMGGGPGQSGVSFMCNSGNVSQSASATVLRQCRNSNSSLNCDRTTYLAGGGEEMVQMRCPQQQHNQRRLSSIRQRILSYQESNW